LRSRNLLKRKEVYDAEYEIVDFTQGKNGVEINAVIWICQTPNKKLFNVTPNLPLKSRYKIFNECKAKNNDGFIKKYKNRLLTIEYRALSSDGIPLHSKGITIRDFE
jgi:hypothetical protein